MKLFTFAVVCALTVGCGDSQIVSDIELYPPCARVQPGVMCDHGPQQVKPDDVQVWPYYLLLAS